MVVTFNELAERELHDAAYYESEQLGLGAAFILEVERSTQVIVEFPSQRLRSSAPFAGDCMTGSRTRFSTQRQRRKSGFWPSSISTGVQATGLDGRKSKERVSVVVLGKRRSSLHPRVDYLPFMMVDMRLPAAPSKRIAQHREPLDLRHLEQTPPDRRLTRSRRTAELVNEQTLAAVLNAVVVRLGDACGTTIPDFDESSVGDRESNLRAG